jgi:hypothetical protein
MRVGLLVLGLEILVIFLVRRKSRSSRVSSGAALGSASS